MIHHKIEREPAVRHLWKEKKKKEMNLNKMERECNDSEREKVGQVFCVLKVIQEHNQEMPLDSKNIIEI